MAGILDYFPKHLSAPREGQVKILKEIEAKWSTHNVFVITAPVAAGKSAISCTIAEWASNSAIITPSNILRNQYAAEYSSLMTIKRKDEFFCSELRMDVKRRMNKYRGELCHSSFGCAGCNSYTEMRQAYQEKETTLLGNYYGYFAAGQYGDAYRKTLIIDEAHNLYGIFQNLAAKKIWQHKAGFPDGMRTALDRIAWAESLSDYELQEGDPEDIALLKLFKEQATSETPNYLFELTREPYGKSRELKTVLKMLPVDITGIGATNLMWPALTKHIILLSATISAVDIEKFGLDKRRVCYIDIPSPIPEENRPIIIPRERKSMAYANQESHLPVFLKFVKEIAAERYQSKGLVHVPYSLARKLQEELGSDKRYVFHDNKTKISQYQYFRNSSEPLIFVASGMNEGIDLPDDFCRWQIIAKIPYPSLADLAVRWQMKKDPKGYAWTSIKDTIQASGRVCRHPNDYGETFIFDECFERLYYQNSELFAEWFKQALRWEPKVA